MTADSQPFVDHLPRPPRLVDEVVSRLRDSIVDGTIPAGTRLPQVALATQLNVSRTPLREALRVLESEGLLRTADNNRTIEVVTVAAGDLREMYELREVIDGLAARLAARNGLSGEYEGRARHLLDELAESSEPYDPVRRNRAHAAFHELIADASKNSKVRAFAPLIRTSSAVLYLPFIRKSTGPSPTSRSSTKPRPNTDRSSRRFWPAIRMVLRTPPGATSSGHCASPRSSPLSRRR
jgi:GntR family transcriptional regulator of vanillate catabolism